MIDPIAELEKRLEKMTAAQFARELGITEPFVRAVRLGEKKPSPKLLRALGLERIIRVEYRKIRAA